MSTTTSGSGYSVNESRPPFSYLDSQKYVPSTEDPVSSVDIANRGGHSRGSVTARSRLDRSPSPTKGAGGFVQSAILKRSDSVNKRWSAQAPPGLSRHSSTASNRSGLGGSRDVFGAMAGSGSGSKIDVTPRGSSRGNSNEPRSRPTSSYGNLKGTQSSGNTPDEKSDDGFVKPHLPVHGRTRSVVSASAHGTADFAPPEANSPPSSPSKRWSPTKSSWLESALQKPDSPKPKLPPPQQPSWMAEISKAKQQRSSVNLGNSNGAESNEKLPSNTSAAADLESTPQLAHQPPKRVELDTPAVKAQQEKTPPAVRAKSPVLSSKLKSVVSDNFSSPHSLQRAGLTRKATDSSADTDTAPGTPGRSMSITSNSGIVGPKSKPNTAPKHDFRSTLKSRQGSTDIPKKEENELQSVFGKLRRTQTQNYVAPDELKSNILQGKAALALTGGPQKSVRRDEFQESLIKQKEAMKVKATEGAGAGARRSSSDKLPNASVPEALEKKKQLGTPRNKGSVTGSGNELNSHITDSPATATDLRNRLKASSPEKLLGPSADPIRAAVPKSSKLANRFNPALAGILARGPSPMQSSGGAAAEPGESNIASSMKAESHDRGNTPSEPLKHMTKGRARGPKRRLPTAKVEVTNDTAMSLTPSTALKTRQADPPKMPKPVTVAKPSIIKQRCLPSDSGAEDVVAVPEKSSPIPRMDRKFKATEHKIDDTANGKTGNNEVSGKDTVALREQQTPNACQFVSGTKSPGKALAVNINPGNTLAIPKSPISPHPQVTKSPTELPSKNLPKLPVDSGANIGAQRLTTTTSPLKQSASGAEKPTKPLPQSDGIKLFGDYFDELPVIPQTLDSVDAQALLLSAPFGDSKVKTLRKQIHETHGDGRMAMVPSHQEHVLFEESMYVCTHVFGGEGGARTTEVYLWAGCEVPEPTIEDAQLFARKVAKENGGKLFVLKQGKESSNFFQALGGIVITRRGSRSNESNRYVLCGRRHMGHIAFDEVDFGLSSFCSGFPYIISNGGKLFLWKGVGCGAEELGCARLISMDLATSAELIEIDEGCEPDSFLSHFATDSPSRPTIPRSADHWRLKVKYDKYHVRLFRLEHRAEREQSNFQVSSLWPLVMSAPSWQDITLPTFGAPQTKPMISEIAPFCQMDLEPEYVYVLDAFFEIYM